MKDKNAPMRTREDMAEMLVSALASPDLKREEFVIFKDGVRYGYQRAAAIESERAKPLVEALEKVLIEIKEKDHCYFIETSGYESALKDYKKGQDEK